MIPSKEESLKAIRKRLSYKFFQKELEFCSKPHTVEEQLRHLMNIIDDRNGWGSQTQANYAQESLELLLKDSKP
jgi:hypothetical protein